MVSSLPLSWPGRTSAVEWKIPHIKKVDEDFFEA
jgi:hypothetical protein